MATRKRQGCQPYVPAALYPQVSLFLKIPGTHFLSCRDNSSTSQINVEIQKSKKPNTTIEETIKMAETITGQQVD
jgi:hypothetical protein